MSPYLRKLLGLNWLLVVLTIALAIFGVIAIYSATYMRTDTMARTFGASRRTGSQPARSFSW
jgi:cell division protein FtsW (lipid II flippase)